MYQHIIFRLLLVAIILYATQMKLSYGLIACFFVICLLNQTSVIEGLESNIANTNTNANTNASANTNTTTSSQDNLTETVKAALQEGQEEDETDSGVDRESVAVAMAAKASNSIPVDIASKNAENVSASKSTDLTGTTASLTEGFCPCAAPV